jgi:hypothetical protein
MTVKYIYGPATVSAEQDAVIGSSISGRLESHIGLGRLTTIASTVYNPCYFFVTSQMKKTVIGRPKARIFFLLSCPLSSQ